MKDLENNKIFAAILVAGLIAAGGHFISEKLVNPLAVKAPGAEAAGDAGAPADAAPEQPQPILDLIAKADPDKGKSIAKACGACHNFDKGGPNMVGPNLWNVMTRGKAAKADYSYSDDMAKHKGQMWTYEDLNHFIWKPKSYVAGTKMTFPGLPKAQDRADVIAFLRTQADAPPAEPSAAEIVEDHKELDPKPAPGATVKPGAPATAPNNIAAPAGQSGAAATPVTKGKAPDAAESPTTDKSSPDQLTPAATPTQVPQPPAPTPEDKTPVQTQSE